jgi:hypothetical protein
MPGNSRLIRNAARGVHKLSRVFRTDRLAARSNKCNPHGARAKEPRLTAPAAPLGRRTGSEGRFAMGTTIAEAVVESGSA